MIIAVGFKVNNERSVQFGSWANFIVKGCFWVLFSDAEILKDAPQDFVGGDFTRAERSHNLVGVGGKSSGTS